jgi:hypothetical protein
MSSASLPGAHSNAGGGGERVLWTAIALMQRTEPDVISVVYSGDTNASKEHIIAKAKVRGVFAHPPLPLCATFTPSLSLAVLLFGDIRLSVCLSVCVRPAKGQV